MKKYIFLSLIIMTIFVSGCALITKEPKEEIKQENPWKELLDTSTWKTYENTEYGFSLRYPESFKIVSAGYPENYFIKRIEFNYEDRTFLKIDIHDYDKSPLEAEENVHDFVITRGYMDKKYIMLQENKGEMLNINGIYIDKYLSFLDGYFYKSEFFIDRNYLVMIKYLDMGKNYEHMDNYIKDEKGLYFTNQEYVSKIKENIESEKVDSYILDQIQIYTQMLNSLKKI